MSEKKAAKAIEFQEYLKVLKGTRREYRKQNREFVKILEFYAKDPVNGELARAALKAWDERLSTDSDLERHYKKTYRKGPVLI